MTTTRQPLDKAQREALLLSFVVDVATGTIFQVQQIEEHQTLAGTTSYVTGRTLTGRQHRAQELQLLAAPEQLLFVSLFGRKD
jgi:hypothetical protein